MNIKRVIPLGALVLLSACHDGERTGPTIVNYSSHNAQQLAPDNSMMGTSCSGSDVTHSIRLMGHTFMNVEFRVSNIGPYGEGKDLVFTAPATYDVQTIAYNNFDGDPSHLSCSGHAVKTVIRRENGKTYLDWWMEISADNKTAYVEPWQISGREEVNEATGTASGSVAATAFGKNLSIKVIGKPGAAYLEQWRHDRVKKLEERRPTGLVGGHMLPDEKPGRKLSDDIVGGD